LARHLDTGHDAGDDLGLHGPPLARGVKVDDVDAFGAVGREATRHRDRVVAVLGDRVVGTLREAHHAAAQQVDGRDQLHVEPSAMS